QVHHFCGTGCHAYPPPNTFPRRYWRNEVERGFRFFEQSGLALKPPPVESVVRYYEERAPEELDPAVLKSASRPLGVRFERLGFPGPRITGSFAISHVNLVHLPDPTRPTRTGGSPPLDVLACDMKVGVVMLLRPYEPSPTWKVIGRVSNPAH